MSPRKRSGHAETLGAKQRRFARMLPRLLDKAHELGFEVTLGDAYRDPRVFGAIGVRMGYGESRMAAPLLHEVRATTP